MRIPEKIESGADIAPVGDQKLKNTVQVFDGRLTIELHHCVEGFESPIGQISLGVEFDEVGEEGGSDRVGLGFEAKEKVVNEREVFGAAEFDDKNEVGRVRVAEVGLVGGVVEDFFGEERVCLGGDQFLDSTWRPN
jgi:hypothetical protein